MKEFRDSMLMIDRRIMTRDYMSMNVRKGYGVMIVDWVTVVIGMYVYVCHYLFRGLESEEKEDDG